MMRNILLSGLWYFSLGPIELWDCAPQNWSVMPWATSTSLKHAAESPDSWSNLIIFGYPLYIVAQHFTNAFHTSLALFSYKAVAFWKFVWVSTTCQIDDSSNHIAFIASSWFKKIRSGEIDTLNLKGLMLISMHCSNELEISISVFFNSSFPLFGYTLLSSWNSLSLEEGRKCRWSRCSLLLVNRISK